MGTQNIIPDSERHRPDSPEEKLAMYDGLHKIPAVPPCDTCPWRKYPDRVQGCDNAGCGYVRLYFAVKYYRKALGWWPYAGKEVETAKMLLTNAMDLLKRVQKEGDQKDEN